MLWKTVIWGQGYNCNGECKQTLKVWKVYWLNEVVKESLLEDILQDSCNFWPKSLEDQKQTKQEQNNNKCCQEQKICL